MCNNRHIYRWIDGWMDGLISGQRNSKQVIRLVELSKIKCLLESHYFNDILSVSLSQFWVWHTFSNEKSATDRSHVGAAEVLLSLCQQSNPKLSVLKIFTLKA